MVNYLTEAELKFQYLFCHKMAPGGVEARGRLLAPQMDPAALGASLARPTGHSRGLGTAASIVGAPVGGYHRPVKFSGSLYGCNL